MSTQPGKSTGKASGSSPGSGGGSKKTSAASSRSDRDEATVNIPDAVSDETRPDLRATKDDDKIAPVTDDTSSDSWAKPAEPSGSVSADRADQPTGRPAGSGFTGTAVKDRPASPFPGTPVAGAGSTPPGATGPAAAGPGSPAPGSTGPGSTAPGKPATPARPTRKAQLQLSRLEPWSVMKFSFMMSLVCFVVLLVAVIVLYVILSGLGVFSAISDTVNDLTRQQGETTGGLDAGNWFAFTRVFTYSLLVGALNVLLITALSTVGSVIYNLVADLVGGVEVTLKEAE